MPLHLYNPRQRPYYQLPQAIQWHSIIDSQNTRQQCIITVTNFTLYYIAILKELSLVSTHSGNQLDWRDLLVVLQCYSESICLSLRKFIDSGERGIREAVPRKHDLGGQEPGKLESKDRKANPLTEEISQEFKKIYKSFVKMLDYQFLALGTPEKEEIEISSWSPLQLLLRVIFNERHQSWSLESFINRIKGMASFQDFKFDMKIRHASEGCGIPRMIHLFCYRLNTNNEILVIGFTRERWTEVLRDLDQYFYEKRAMDFTIREKEELQDKREAYYRRIHQALNGKSNQWKLLDARLEVAKHDNPQEQCITKTSRGESVALQVPEMIERYRCPFCLALFEYPMNSECDRTRSSILKHAINQGYRNKSDARLAIACAEADTEIRESRLTADIQFGRPLFIQIETIMDQDDVVADTAFWLSEGRAEPTSREVD